MGSWGIGNFDNDDAMDWVIDLQKSKNLHVLLFPLNIINSSVEFLEAPDCREALAAADVIVARLNDDITEIPEEARKWVRKRRRLFRKTPQVTAYHAEIAKMAVEKIIYDSELKDQMVEAFEFGPWLQIQEHLIEKLRIVIES